MLRTCNYLNIFPNKKIIPTFLPRAQHKKVSIFNYEICKPYLNQFLLRKNFKRTSMRVNIKPLSKWLMLQVYCEVIIYTVLVPTITIIQNKYQTKVALIT